MSITITFRPGNPYHHIPTGDPTDIDYSVCGYWVCPIHMYTDGDRYCFVLDASLDYQDADAVVKKATLIADLLNKAVDNPEWRATNLWSLIGGFDMIGKEFFEIIGIAQ
jgi:hypothetical protein